LFLYLRVSDFNELLRNFAASKLSRRWQEKMATIFEPVPSLNSGKDFAVMQEVFFMSGAEAKYELSLEKTNAE
jgi:L-rhamnose mutarotase